MSSYAWGPERKVFTETDLPGFACLNSVVDNPGVGDERNFVRVRQAGSTATRTDAVRVTEGGVYEVYIYFRNDATVAMAKDVRVQTNFSQVINSAHSGEVMAAIYASNTTPIKVWDRAKFWTNDELALTLNYVEGSAKINTNGAANGTLLMEEIFATGGVAVGYDVLDGNLPAGIAYSGYITYEVKAERATGAIDYNEKVGADINEEVEAAGEGAIGSGEGAGSGAGAGSAGGTGAGATDMPTTGSNGIVFAILMGALVAFGWSVLRKIVNRDKIR